MLGMIVWHKNGTAREPQNIYKWFGVERGSGVLTVHLVWGEESVKAIIEKQ